MEFEVLALFARSPGKVMDRDYILDRTKGMEWEPYNRSIDVLISRLRQKLGDDPRKPAFLKTVRGAGYMYIGDEEGSRRRDRMNPEGLGKLHKRHTGIDDRPAAAEPVPPPVPPIPDAQDAAHPDPGRAWR